MHAGPSITPGELIESLITNGIVDENQLVGILGADRHNISLNRLEMLLLKANVLSPQRLLLLKGMIAGLPTLDETMRVLAELPAQLARAAGVLLVESDVPTVAIVEDLPVNLERVAHHLGTPDFDLVLMTAQQFTELFKATYQGEKTETRPATKDLFEILDEAVRRRASDIHLSVGEPPCIRVDGTLVFLDRRPLDKDWMYSQLARFAGEECFASLLTSFDEDFAYGYGASRFRVNLGWDRNGPTMAGRKLPTKIPTPDDLGLPRAIRDFCHLERGLVLVTGPTGSGKSTTLACLLNQVAQHQSRHLITLEDPIEFLLPSGKALVQQRELGVNFTSFPGGLRQALRQDPDVVLVGEMRDLETTRTAITAAETGHLVFGTLHTYDASSSVARMISQFPSDEQEQIRSQLAYILKGIVSQTLLPLAAGQGRVAAYEVMVSTPAIANNLRKVDGHNALRQSIELGTNQGMQTMDMALSDLVRRAVVRETEAEFRARDLEEFHRRVHS